MSGLPVNKELRQLVLKVIRLNPGATCVATKGHFKVQAPGLRLVMVAGTPGNWNAARSAAREFVRAGYRIE